MFGNALIMLALPLVAYYINGPNNKFWAVFALLFVFGSVNGMVSCSVFAGAGFLPGKYMGAVMFGNGIAGIAVNVLKVLLMVIFPAGDD